MTVLGFASVTICRWTGINLSLWDTVDLHKRSITKLLLG